MSCEQNLLESNGSGYVFESNDEFAITSRESCKGRFAFRVRIMIAIFMIVLGPHSTSSWRVHMG